MARHPREPVPPTTSNPTRRDVVLGGAATALAAAAGPPLPAAVPGPSRPVAVASANGLEAVRRAVARMAAGEPAVDAAVAGVGLVEDDPDDVTVGFKLPGRVGDSPLIGAGLFVDNEVGAAGSTGRGESVIQVAGSHTIVELMRRGAAPTDACLGALERVVRATRLPDLLDDRGRPAFDVQFYAVSRSGEVGAAAMWSGSRYATCRAGEEPALHDCAHLYARA